MKWTTMTMMIPIANQNRKHSISGSKIEHSSSGIFSNIPCRFTCDRHITLDDLSCFRFHDCQRAMNDSFLRFAWSSTRRVFFMFKNIFWVSYRNRIRIFLCISPIFVRLKRDQIVIAIG